MRMRALNRDEQELWLRTPLMELLERLDLEEFWQIHPGTVVRVDAIAAASHDTQDQWRVQLQGQPDQHKVSRLFAHRFRAM